MCAIPRRSRDEVAAKEPNGAIWANQFDNLANRRAHYETTGPEIWEDTGGKVDAFVASVGTGGTLAGVAMALKERNKSIRNYLADPLGSAIYSYYARGELKAEGNSITEGIGQGRITKNLEGAPIDGWFQVTDEEMLPVLFDLVLEEGLILGGSTGINIVGAIKAAARDGAGSHHRHHPRRLWHALPIEAVQSRIPAGAPFAGAELARRRPIMIEASVMAEPS